jgi:hypothetical protein
VNSVFRKLEIVVEIPIGDYALVITHNYNSIFFDRHKPSA